MISNRFTLSLKDFFGLDYVVPLGRAALGIYAALKAWGGSGPVALQATVCHDVIAAVLMAGRQPFFCDVDPNTGVTPATEWWRARRQGADAAIVIHLYGNLADTVAARAAFHGALLIDDAAQALGARSADYLAGTGGDVGLVSFGQTKHIEAGGAAMLCRSASFAQSCRDILNDIQPSEFSNIKIIDKAFRTKFQSARERLIHEGTHSGFSGLLKGYAPALKVAWRDEWGLAISTALSNYPERLAERREKARYWHKAINGTGLVPVGMNNESAPWRFACRLPGCNWSRQHRIATALRERGLEVSNWYLPGHWFLGSTNFHLPGVEQLARESFQFWLNEDTSVETIHNAAAILNEYFIT
jgi:dTDP-4-amino-4,6-dideoxygalactose transaminase